MTPRTRFDVRRAGRAACVVAASFLALATAAAPARAQDAPAEEDPVPALEAAAEAAQGDAAAAAWTKLAAALESRGRWTEAAGAWRRVPDPAARVAEGRCLLAFAEELLAAGEPGAAVKAAFEDARAVLDVARRASPGDAATRIGLARCLAADGRTDEQIAELRAAAADLPGDPAPRRALGFALYNAGRHADALGVLRPMSDAAPDDLNVSLTAAESARVAGDEALAVELAKRTIEHHPEDRRGWKAVWDVYAGAKRWKELGAVLAALAHVRPESALAAHYSGFAAASGQDWDEALRRLADAWRLDPRNVAARLESARILLQHKKDRDAAGAAVREVLDADPANRQAASLLSFVAQRRSEDGDHEGAVRDLEDLSRRRPEDSLVLANLALELRWSGRTADSEAAYLRAIELSPRDQQLRNDLGLLYLVLRRDADARAQFLAGVEADPQANDNLENLGWMALDAGDLEQAASWYRKAYDAALARGGDGARHRRHLDAVRWPLPPAGTPR